MEPGPVVLVTTRDGRKNNIMTISWTMVLDFAPAFGITTGEWNHSYTALHCARTRNASSPLPPRTCSTPWCCKDWRRMGGRRMMAPKLPPGL